MSDPVASRGPLMICGTRMMRRPPRRIPVRFVNRSLPLAASALALGGGILGVLVGLPVALLFGHWWVAVVTGSLAGLGGYSLTGWRPEGVSPQRALARRGRRAISETVEMPDGTRALVYVGICGPMRRWPTGEMVRIVQGRVSAPPE